VTGGDTLVYGGFYVADMIVQAEVLDLRPGVTPTGVFTCC